MAQTVKRLPAVWETGVQSLGWEDPLEKENATHSSTLAWKIPWTEDPGRLQSMGLQRVGHNGVTSLYFRQIQRMITFYFDSLSVSWLMPFLLWLAPCLNDDVIE